MREINRILVLCRYTRNSQQAIHYGVEMARNCGADLYILHVDDDPFNLRGWNLGIPLGTMKKEFKKTQQAVKVTLDKVINSELEKGGPVKVRNIIAAGDSVREVMRLVEKEKIDLLIMLAHEEGQLEHLLFDRDNQKIIRRLPCSIYLLKTKWV